MNRYKSIALTLLLNLFALLANAQGGNSISEAVRLNLGDNSCSFSAGDDYNSFRYYVFNSRERGLLKLECVGSEVTFRAVDANGEELSCIKGIGTCIIPVQAGVDSYLTVCPNMPFEEDMNIGFYASFEANDNAGRGMSKDDPIKVTEGKMNITTNAVADFGEFTSYFTYTAAETGALTLALSGYVLSGKYGTSFEHLDGTFSADYNDGSYVASIPVNEGQTVCFTILAYSPMTVMAKMTHPEKGSTPNYPIELVEGQNDVSAEFGEFWYKYNGASADGYVTIRSAQELPRGHVCVHPSNDIYTTLAKSETGYYDLRFKVEAHKAYLIYIYKTEESEDWPDPDHIDVSFTPFQQGETSRNPLPLTVDKSVELNSMNGTYYYTISVPEGSEKMLEMTVNGEAANSCHLTLFDTRDGQYYAATGMERVQKVAQGGSTFMLIVEKNRVGEAVLSPVVRDIKAGEAITSPIVAQVGTSVVDKAADVYYTYTATLTGRIGVKFDIPGVDVEFPVSTNPNEGSYVIVRDEGQQKIDVVKGQTYYMHFRNVSEDCHFTFTEREYLAGETRDLAIEVTENKVTLASGVMNAWYRYVAAQDGKMILSSDIIGNEYTYIQYLVNDGQYPSAINTHNGEEGQIVYYAAFSVKQGDVVYVHLTSDVDRGGNVIRFDLRDFEVGESPEKPIEIALGASPLEIPAATRTQSIWVRVPLHGAKKVLVSTDRFVAGGIYTSKDFSRGFDLGFTADENNEVHTAIYESAHPVESLYVCFTQSLGKIVVHAEDLSSSFDGIDAMSTQKEDVFYDVTGVRQAAAKRGLNIVRKGNGRVVKVLKN